MATATSGASFNNPIEPQQHEDDVIDQTAQSIANIFGLDLTTASDAQEATELVTNAVYRFIELYQECQEELTEANSQLSQLREENGLDADGNPIQDPNNPDPNAPVPDPDDPTQQLPGQPPAVPQQGVPPQQQQPGAPPQGKPSPFGKKPQPGAPAPAAGKKPNPFAKKQPIAASFTPAVLKMAHSSRRNEILSLAEAGCCTAEIANEMIRDYCNENALSLSLSGDGSPGAFEREISRLQRNGKVIHYGEQTGEQTQHRALEMSHGPGMDTAPSSSPLVADAANRKDK